MPAREKTKQGNRRMLTQLPNKAKLKEVGLTNFIGTAPGGLLEGLLRNKDPRAIDRLTFRGEYLGGIYNKISNV